MPSNSATQPSRRSLISDIASADCTLWSTRPIPASATPNVSVMPYPATAAKAVMSTVPATLNTNRSPSRLRAIALRAAPVSTDSSRTPTAVRPRSETPATIDTSAIATE
jgi:hypothetical protein